MPIVVLSVSANCSAPPAGVRRRGPRGPPPRAGSRRAAPARCRGRAGRGGGRSRRPPGRCAARARTPRTGRASGSSGNWARTEAQSSGSKSGTVRSPGSGRARSVADVGAVGAGVLRGGGSSDGGAAGEQARHRRPGRRRGGASGGGRHVPHREACWATWRRTTWTWWCSGSGPGGEYAAQKLAEAGLDVVGVDRDLVGGECPFYGCVPSKMMIRAADALGEARRVDAPRRATPRSTPTGARWPTGSTSRPPTTGSDDSHVRAARGGRGPDRARRPAGSTAPARVRVGEDDVRRRRAASCSTSAPSPATPADRRARRRRRTGPTARS